MRIRRLLHLGFVWLLLGYATGTLLLLGPVRWVTSTLREAGAPGWQERAAVIAIILLLVGGTAWGAWRIQRWSRRSDGSAGSVLAHLGLLAAAGTALWLWLTPSVLAPSAPIPQARPGFTFGAYPEAEDLATLESRGYSAVVSLLHPAVVPAEPRLLAREREAVGKTGLEFIHVPLLPWVGDNEAALEKLERLARERRGERFFVHCYLGRDRIRLAARVVREAGAPVSFTDETAEALSLADSLQFERGPVRRIADSVWVGPQPTEEEWMAYLLANQVRSVVTVGWPQVPSRLERVVEEAEMLRPYVIDFVFVDPETAGRRAREILRLEPPVYVHGFHSPSPELELFLEAVAAGADSVR